MVAKDIIMLLKHICKFENLDNIPSYLLFLGSVSENFRKDEIKEI